jgi:hypothetical protein
MAANPDWESLSIQIPGQDLLEGARNVLETLVVFLEVLKTILETVKVFLVDFGNPIKAIVEALIQRILQLFESLRRSGIYGWFDVPNPLVDPNFNRHVGGFEAFLTRFKAGLYDSRDPNRPQPLAGLSNSGFTIIVADAENAHGLVRLIEILLQFLGKEFLSPQYQAPPDFKVLPLGGDGDPVLSVVKLFQDQPESVVVEWSSPQTSVSGDPGFSDLANTVGFIPPRFLIEKCVETNPAVGEVDVSALGDVDAAGPVVATIPTRFESRGKPGAVIERKVRLHDNYNDPFLKFQQYIVIDASTNTSTFLLGQLGTFRYLDDDVEVGKTYYYRVRAYSGDLDVSGTTVVFEQPKTNVIDSNPYIEWPGDNLVMGKASPTVPIRIPIYPPDFDVIETLKRLFQVAFSLNFHLPLPEGAKFNPDGTAIEPSATSSDIGRGSLTSLAGPLTSFQAIPLVGDAVSGITDVTAAFQRDPATGLLPELPWNNTNVRRNSTRLATMVAGAMLEANSAVPFKALMEGVYPNGTPNVEGLDATNLANLVFEITEVQNPDIAGQGGVQDAGVLYGTVWADPTVRLNVLAAVNFCKSFTLGGSPPDWIQVSFLRDIVPWSGQLLYDLLAKMQALLDAYSGVIDELNAFIDLIIRKIDTLEQFLQYLISILDFIEGLSLGYYILSVPSTGGDVNEWVSLIENAGGTLPPSGPGGYTGGVALAYVAPDVGPFEEAFGLIF